MMGVEPGQQINDNPCDVAGDVVRCGGDGVGRDDRDGPLERLERFGNGLDLAGAVPVVFLSGHEPEQKPSGTFWILKRRELAVMWASLPSDVSGEAII